MRREEHGSAVDKTTCEVGCARGSGSARGGFQLAGPALLSSSAFALPIPRHAGQQQSHAAGVGDAGEDKPRADECGEPEESLI